MFNNDALFTFGGNMELRKKLMLANLVSQVGTVHVNQSVSGVKVVEVPVFVRETRTKGCHARCQALCGCNPTMQYVRLRIIFLNRRNLKLI